jgi:hypothetical protein
MGPALIFGQHTFWMPYAIKRWATLQAGRNDSALLMPGSDSRRAMSPFS